MQTPKRAFERFDEIAKILFVKVWVERELRAKRQRDNLFSIRVLDEQIAAMDRREMLDGAGRWALAGGWFNRPLEQNIGPDSNHAVPAVTIHAIRREFSRRCAESGYRYLMVVR